AETHHPAPRTCDEILADFTAQAADCQNVSELQSIYKAAWNAMASSAEHQQKCIDVYKLRASELKKVA
ncbi:single-stranded DNA-binding protein, partial [Yersinia enterocolitica]|nr:single-stranded DNA-binding protein [Yersinia enterocolitica]